MPQRPSLRIGIDLDDTITYCPEFFSAMTIAMQSIAEIHIITNREPTAASRDGTIEELRHLDIAYHQLALTGDKGIYICEQGITVYFDDSDAHLLQLPESVAVFKMREPGNFDFDARRWAEESWRC